jgi:hypothetical protein
MQPCLKILVSRKKSTAVACAPGGALKYIFYCGGWILSAELDPSGK